MIPIVENWTHWVCPNCTLEQRTSEPRAHTRMHPCKGRGGMILPMIQKGVKAHVRLVEREDYVGNEKVQLRNGRPIMAAITEREDGQDVHVFAPAATGRDPHGR